MTIVRKNHGRNHSYWVDGAKLPGVTTILKMRPNDALVGWAGRVTAEYAVDNWDELARLRYSQRLNRLLKARTTDRDLAAGRGTKVHRLAEKIIVGEEVEYPEELAAHVMSYVDFLDRLDVQPVAVELVVANRAVGYCGTSDLIADLPALVWDETKIPAGRWLLDLKTSRSGIFPESALQTCAYARAEFYADGDREVPVSELGVEHTGAVHVRADGWDLRPLENSPGTWEYFQHLAWMHHHDEEPASWVGMAVDPPPPPPMVMGDILPAPRRPAELAPVQKTGQRQLSCHGPAAAARDLHHLPIQ